MKKISLNGNWKSRYYEHCPEMPELFQPDTSGNEWVIAAVPGDIHKDLENAGLINDPYYDDNFLQCQWVTEKDWYFVKEFNVPKGFLKKHTFLIFDGIDTFADIYLNG